MLYKTIKKYPVYSLLTLIPVFSFFLIFQINWALNNSTFIRWLLLLVWGLTLTGLYSTALVRFINNVDCDNGQKILFKKIAYIHLPFILCWGKFLFYQNELIGRYIGLTIITLCLILFIAFFKRSFSLTSLTPGNEQQKSGMYFLPIIMIMFLVIILIRNAWMSDDALITYRTIGNWINGYGLRWNISERVQSYTHPLWMFVMSFFYFFTIDFYYTPIIVSILFSMAAIIIVMTKSATSKKAAFIGCLLILISKAFIDYTTSGLENPLTFLLLAIFFYLYFTLPVSYGTLFKISLTASLIAVNRQDCILLVFPAVIYMVVQLYMSNTESLKKFILTTLVTLIKGFLPIILWELFSLFYYGFPFPNTAYAKLNVKADAMTFYKQGYGYFLNSFSWDFGTLLTIFSGIIIAFVSKEKRKYALAVGIILYLLYIVKIGGDFMSGRFFAAPFFIAVALIVHTIPAGRLKNSELGGIIALIVLIGLTSPYSPLLTTHEFTHDNEDPRGIADEKGFYFARTALIRDYRRRKIAVYPYQRVRINYDYSTLKVETHHNIGDSGLTAGPAVHIVDGWALADPLLARLPGNFDRVGHYSRSIPPGYIQSINSDTNQIGDKDIARYYDRLRLVISGKLFSFKRMVEIVKFNFNIITTRDKKSVNRKTNLLSNCIRYKNDSFKWDEASNIVDFKKLLIDIGFVSKAPMVDISFDCNDVYELQFYYNSKKVGAKKILPAINKNNLVVRFVKVPESAVKKGYNKIIVHASGGDFLYSMGHIRLLREVEYTQINTARQQGGRWDGSGNVVFNNTDGIVVNLGQKVKIGNFSVSVRNNSPYLLSFLDGNKKVGDLLLNKNQGSADILTVHSVKVPPSVSLKGFNRVVIQGLYEESANIKYSLGHLALVP